MKTLKELAQEALNVQDASNLSGVVKGFDRAIQDLKVHYSTLGTNDFNSLPIVAMWADKIASLTHTQNMGGVQYSYILDEVTKLAHS